MGIFGRNRSKLKTRPIPGRDDLVEVQWESLKESAVPDAEAIHASFSDEISTGVKRLLAAGSFMFAKSLGNLDTQILLRTGAQFGYVARRVEIERKDVALSYEGLAMIGTLRNRMGEGEEGFICSMNAALNLANFPFDRSYEEEDHDFVVPGWYPLFRKAIAEVTMRALILSTEENGQSESCPSLDTLIQVFGFGYMTHLWEEIGNNSWLDGMEGFEAESS